MKRLTCIWLAVCLVFVPAACRAKEEGETEQGEPPSMSEGLPEEDEAPSPLLREGETPAAMESRQAPQAQEEDPIGPDQEIDPVTMGVSQFSYPVGTEAVEVVITNSTARECNADLYYEVCWNNNGGWNTLELDFGVKDLGVILAPDGTWSQTIHLYPDQHDYRPGAYRIQKRVFLGEESHLLTAEFVLE